MTPDSVEVTLHQCLPWID